MALKETKLNYAYHFGSYRLPSLSLQNAREYLHIYWQLTRKYQRTLGFMLASNALFAMFITYNEGNMFYKMQLKRLTERAEVENKVYGSVSKGIVSQISDEQTVDPNNKSVKN